MILDGAGYEIHDNQRFDWEAGDIVYVPPNTIHQHFNADPGRPARLISAINRIFKNSGLNDLEQIENAPEYDALIVAQCRTENRCPLFLTLLVSR